ncbi:hypothetical protein GCM10010198_72300 [Nocardia seriolae]|nr:hypothetical protein NS2_39640 [Nocardia seriolae NBRC 15557]
MRVIGSPGAGGGGESGRRGERAGAGSEGDGAGRPPLPALMPEGGGRGAGVGEAEVDGGPGWASWLSEATAAGAGAEYGGGRVKSASPYDIAAEDPMAALVVEARRRAAQTQRRMRIRRRILAVAGVSLAVVAAAVAGWLVLAPGDSGAPRAVPMSSTAAAPTKPANQPGLVAWCQERTSPDRVSGASAGDLGSGPGVIMRLEYAWYVQRDPAAVRALLAPDAKVAPEQATRDAIAATPTGTKHCVNITGADADHWNVTIDEQHPDGTQTSWQQVITTANRDGQVLITAIVSGSR